MLQKQEDDLNVLIATEIIVKPLPPIGLLKVLQRTLVNVVILKSRLFVGERGNSDRAVEELKELFQESFVYSKPTIIYVHDID